MSRLDTLTTSVSSRIKSSSGSSTAPPVGWDGGSEAEQRFGWERSKSVHEQVGVEGNAAAASGASSSQVFVQHTSLWEVIPH